MFCKYCGQTLQKSERKCSRCGSTVPAMSECGGFSRFLAVNPAPVEKALPEERKLPEKQERKPSVLIPVLAGVIALVLLLLVVQTVRLAGLEAQVTTLDRENERLRDKIEEFEETVPQATVPELTDPEPAETEQTVPEETAPPTTAPEETAPPTTAPEETVPLTTAPEETVPLTTAPEETVPQATASEQTLPAETEPVQTVPEEAVPSESLPQ